MARNSGWRNTDNAEQQLGESGRHTLVTFPKSRKSIIIKWAKVASKRELGYNFGDDENLEGVFIYDGVRLRMTYEYNYYKYAYNGEETERVIPSQERDRLPCKYLVLGIINQKAEIQELTVHEDEQAWSIHLCRGYMDEPGDMHNSIASSSICYDFNLTEMSCAYSYRYSADLSA